MRFIDIHAHLHAYKDDTHLYGKTMLNAHTHQEMQEILTYDQPLVWRSLGVHPQDPNPHSLQTLQDILHNPITRTKVNAIGEMGFDLYGEYRNNLSAQEYYFNEQLQLALVYNLPLIIHQRRAMQHIFQHVKELKQLPAVIFHSYGGTWIEAQSLRKKGVKAYFSIGTPILWGAKISHQLARLAPLEWLLLETDAPYQPMKGAKTTQWHDITLIYAHVAHQRGITVSELEEAIEDNFWRIFNKRV